MDQETDGCGIGATGDIECFIARDTSASWPSTHARSESHTTSAITLLADLT